MNEKSTYKRHLFRKNITANSYTLCHNPYKNATNYVQTSSHTTARDELIHTKILHTKNAIVFVETSSRTTTHYEHNPYRNATISVKTSLRTTIHENKIHLKNTTTYMQNPHREQRQVDSDDDGEDEDDEEDEGDVDSDDDMLAGLDADPEVGAAARLPLVDPLCAPPGRFEG